MMIVAMLFFLGGAVLGLRFTILILIPALGVCLPIVAVAALMYAGSFQVAAAALVVAATALQCGYLGGIFVRFVMVAARARRLRPAMAARALARTPETFPGDAS